MHLLPFLSGRVMSLDNFLSLQDPYILVSYSSLICLQAVSFLNCLCNSFLSSELWMGKSSLITKPFSNIINNFNSLCALGDTNSASVHECKSQMELWQYLISNAVQVSKMYVMWILRYGARKSVCWLQHSRKKRPLCKYAAAFLKG